MRNFTSILMNQRIIQHKLMPKNPHSLVTSLPRWYKVLFISPLFFFFSIITLYQTDVIYASALLQNETCSQSIIHYRRRNHDYDGWGLHVWGPNTSSVSWDAPLQPSSSDEYGVFWSVPMEEGATFINYIVHKGDEKDPGPDQTMTFSNNGCEIWLLQGKEDQFTDEGSALQAMAVTITSSPDVGENQSVIHYRRSKEDYDGWGLHIWGPTAVEGVTWTSPLQLSGQDSYGVYWIIEMEEGADHINYIVHKGDEKDPGPDQTLSFSDVGQEIWLIQGSGEQFINADEALKGMLAMGIGDIKKKAQAHWLSHEIIAWQVEFGSKAIFTLHYDENGAIQVTQDGLIGGKQIVLEYVDNNLSKDLADNFPHLWNSVMLKIPDEELDKVTTILKGQFAITVQSIDGTILGATALQIPGVLDD